jgi:hypothetical protein
VEEEEEEGGRNSQSRRNGEIGGRSHHPGRNEQAIEQRRYAPVVWGRAVSADHDVIFIY